MRHSDRYDIVYSLGEHCACAQQLQRYKLRFYSGPFDWIYNIPLVSRLELMNNDFENFLCIEDLEPFHNKRRNIDLKCDFYKNKKMAPFFYMIFQQMYP